MARQPHELSDEEIRRIEAYTFPSVYEERKSVEEGLTELTLFTYVRKECDKLWYVIPVRYTTQTDHQRVNLLDVYRDLMQQFVHNVYTTQLYYIISPEMQDGHGRDLLILDPDQRSELERVKEKHLFWMK